ncbi:MAG: ribonuclease H [Psychrobacillus sp.]
MSKIVIYTDGGCRGNAKDENIGGYGVVLQYVTEDNTYVKELYDGERNTTNNIQELKGAIKALEAIKTTHIPIELYCDSAYVVNGITSWVKGWKKKGWKKSDGKIVENLELWKQLDQLVMWQDDFKAIKVKGHSTNEGNNRADALANIAMDEVEAND